MATTYQLADEEILTLLQIVRDRYHPVLKANDVRIGVLMAIAGVDEDTGEKTGPAIKGYAGAEAAAQVKPVSLKDRVVKQYDVEILLDGDLWPKLTEPQQIAILDHEMTHIEPTGEVDDLLRPKVKMRKEDFVAWGFWEVIQRHGPAAMEHRALKALADKHGQLLLDLPESLRRESETSDQGGTVTISSAKGSVTVPAAEVMSHLGNQINEHLKSKRGKKANPAAQNVADIEVVPFGGR